MGFQHLETFFGGKYQILLWDICWKIHHSHFLWQFLNFLSKTHFYWSYITTNYLHRLEVIHITTLEPAYWNILTQFAKNIQFSTEIFVEKKHCSHLFFPDFIWLLDPLGPKDQFKTPNSMGFQLLKKKNLRKKFFWQGKILGGKKFSIFLLKQLFPVTFCHFNRFSRFEI